LYIQISKRPYTFVPTNIVSVDMKIEEVIKSNVALDDAKKVLLNLMYAQNVIGDKFNELLKPYDVSAEQYNVLRILRGQKGSAVNMCDIQERMLAKNSNTTRLIDKLLVKDYVTREICPVNRRKMEILITAKGLSFLEELEEKVKAHEQSFASNLTTDELQYLNQLLEKYRTIKNEESI
jgi:DNA-binding MarR family transcriptional regulator